LKWDTAKDNFYAAMRDGIDADLTWMTAEGRLTTDLEVIYEELFSAAKSGLQAQGLQDEQIQQYIEPLRDRVRTRMTPARWKHQMASNYISDGGNLRQAILDTQHAYLNRQADTFFSGMLTDWNLS
jgi:gamma-glutamyl:cysteine ligase YbdK (ATP-grasp superfamily)